MTNAIKSPCILVCQLDFDSGYCLGCGRTGDEIGNWVRMTPSGRNTVMAALPARLESIGMPADGSVAEAEKRATEQRRRRRIRLK